MYISQVSQTLYELHFYKDHKLVMHVKIQAQDTWTSSDCPKFPDLFESMVTCHQKTLNISHRGSPVQVLVFLIPNYAFQTLTNCGLKEI
jgi:hypothetical protein